MNENKKLLHLLLTSTLLVALCLAANTGHRQRYGEVCNRSRKCDFTKWYRCSQMKCVCYNPPGKDELYYDESNKRCVGKSGTNCAQRFFPFDDEDEKIFHSRGTTTNHWRYGNGTLKCGANAFCEFNGKDHFCKCKESYYEAEDGTCAKLKGVRQPCKIESECNPDQFLICQDGVCKCDGTTRVFDEDLQKCVVPAGAPCETRRNKDDGRIVDDCPLNAFCEEGVCHCGFGTQIHSDKTCQKGYGMECGPDHPCGDSKLSCRSRVCQCKAPNHMEYEEALGQCVSLASGPCTLNDSTSEFAIGCTQNAECVFRNLITECRCRPGHIQTEEGKCGKVFGSTCEFDSECDPYPGLACINNNCSCPDVMQHYDEKSRKCRGLMGSRCTVGDDFGCIENSKCVHYDQADKGKIGRCSCKQGFKGTENRTCEQII